ncbi:hypothetical protein [Paenibacillus cremeus]|uniref:MerR family transcriptional regulator n=1 Tax=Paenibacillus cremeus TaxID=2163881 RepID=A0A559JCG6_9BACL|nr:hypothetical protein [Paenibacillus cremeus]TVX97561.1 hypothetical protein FPZ49_35020 [Paenibacillus cremeus]
MHNDFELIYAPKEVHQRLRIADSTFRKWANALKAEGYEFKKEESGNRLFVQRDIEVFEILKQRLDTGQNLKNAASATMMQVQAAAASATTVAVPELLPSSGRSLDVLQDNFTETLLTAIEERVQNAVQNAILPLAAQVAQLTEENRQLAEENREHQKIQNMLSPAISELTAQVAQLTEENRQLSEESREHRRMLPPATDPKAERTERTNEYLTIRRVTIALEQEALEAWAKLPKKERTKSVGLFGSEEDQDKRDWFVKDYCDRYFEDRLRQEFS